MRADGPTVVSNPPYAGMSVEDCSAQLSAYSQIGRVALAEINREVHNMLTEDTPQRGCWPKLVELSEVAVGADFHGTAVTQPLKDAAVAAVDLLRARYDDANTQSAMFQAQINELVPEIFTQEQAAELIGMSDGCCTEAESIGLTPIQPSPGLVAQWRRDYQARPEPKARGSTAQGRSR